MRRKLTAAVVAPFIGVALLVPMAQVSVAATSGTVVLRAAMPAQVRSGQARVVGTLSSKAPINLAVNLNLRHLTRMNATLAALGSPGSATYHRYLSQGQANRLFNPTLAQQNAVESWLVSRGLTVTRTFVNHLIVDARGTPGQIDRAFNVTLTRYSGIINGRRASFYAPSTAPRIPASLGGVVGQVLGLNNADRMTTPIDIKGTAGKLSGLHSGVRSDGYVAGAYYPSDFKAAYNVAPVIAGAGTHLSQQHVGIVMWCDPPSHALLNAFGPFVGAPIASVVLHDFSGGQSGGGDQLESDMDVEYSSGAASAGTHKVTTDYYQTKALSGYAGDTCTNSDEEGDNTSIDNALNAAGTTTGAAMERQISGSFGGCDDGSGAFNALLASNSLTGHNYFFSSGDLGSTCDGTTTNTQYPAGSPYVTAVGGTGFNVCGTLAPKTITSYPGEVAWCYSAPHGSGGGLDTYAATPSWQYKIHSTWGIYGGCLAAHTCRGVPDVSGPADPNQSGAFVCADTSACYQVGGTSLASPLWAGFAADINADFIAHGRTSGVGYVQPSLYALAYNPTTYARDFHDIISGVNGTYSTSIGWDPVTGLGSPNLANLESDWFNLTRAVLKFVGPGKARHSKKVKFSASLKSASGHPIKGRKVTIKLGAKSCTGTTASNGVARCKLTTPKSKGTKKLSLTFKGDANNSSYQFGNTSGRGKVKIK